MSKTLMTTTALMLAAAAPAMAMDCPVKVGVLHSLSGTMAISETISAASESAVLRGDPGKHDVAPIDDKGEIAFDGLQQSDYPGGLALRFARVKRYRSDKRAAEADTMAPSITTSSSQVQA